jgi:hypothetical protein
MNGAPRAGMRAAHRAPCAPQHTPSGSKDAVSGAGRTYL